MLIRPGQVLWLKLPFGKTDDVSSIYHPYLIMETNAFGYEIVLVGQMDTDNGKPWELLQGRKIPVDNNNPKESVIYKPSYLQTDRKIQIEYFPELEQFLDTTEKLSEIKLKTIINKYYNYRNRYGSDNFRDMYFSKEDILKYNPYEEWQKAHLRRIRKYSEQLNL